MIRAFGFSSCFLALLVSCRLPPDRTPLKPLPEDERVFTYEEILSRARAQATVALEAFFNDNWAEVEEAAQGLEQTARFLPKTIEVPTKIKGLAKETSVLQKEALRLRDAARAKNALSANEALQKINFKIRLLRADEGHQSPEKKPPDKNPAEKNLPDKKSLQKKPL